MNGTSDENAENKFGDKSENNQYFSRRKRHRICRTLTYRNTNIGGSDSKRYELQQEQYSTISDKRCIFVEKREKDETFQQRREGPPAKSRWLPTGVSSFAIFCDDSDEEEEVGTSRNCETNRQQEEEENDGNEENSSQNSHRSRKTRRPLATLSPNHESDSDDNMVSDTTAENNEDEDDDYSWNNTSSTDGKANAINDSHSGDEMSSHNNLASHDIQEASGNVANVSTQTTAPTCSGSVMYTTEEHEDPMRADPVYDEDIYIYMRDRELKLHPFGDFLEFQEDICGEVRYLLVEWICDSVQEFNLSTESLHMAVSIIDRVLNAIQCPRQKLQLLGAASLLLASKFEEIYPPEVKEFARITAYTFHESEIIRMERIVFARVEYQLFAPTSWWFASRLVRMAHVPRIIYCMMRYLLELALLDHTFLDFRPSVVGAASFFLSNVIFKSNYSLSTVATDITLNELRLLARKMLQLFHEIPNRGYSGIFEKYAAEKYEQVSCLLLPDNFPELDDS
uniref:Cyclin N-terminal domain-containing protein n=1 Tax=Setaria digitata TaxID=48799 RepID=A0A915PJ08_9BILA